MENSGYQTFQNLKNQFPDQFSDDIIDKLPINDKPSSSSQPSLESYTKSVCNRSLINSSQGQLLLIEVHKDLTELTSLLTRAKRSSVQEMLKNDIKTLKNKLESNLTDPYHFTGKEEEKIAQIDGCEKSASEESAGEEELEYENWNRRRKRSSSYDWDSDSPINRRPTTVFDRDENKLKLISPSKRCHEICNNSILLRAKRSKKDKEEEDDEEGSLENDAIDLQELDSEGLVLMGLPTWLVNPEDLVEGLEEVANGGHKGDSILGVGDNPYKLMFDNKMVRLLGVLKESTPIGDKGTVVEKIRVRHVEKDTLLSKLENKQKVLVWISFLDVNLTAEERKAVWEAYNNKKTACCEEYMQEWKEMVNTIKNTQQIPETRLPKLEDERITARPINTMAITDKLKQMNPKLSQDALVARTWAAIMQLQTMQWAQPKVIDNQSTFNDDQKNKAECEYDQSPGMYLCSHDGNMKVGHRNMRTMGPGAAPDPSHGEVLTLDRGTDTDLPHMASMLVRATSSALRVDLAQEGIPS